MDDPRKCGVALLVEDEWLVRNDMAAYLTEAGWVVHEASTGESAIEQLRDGQKIDLLVTDIKLAGPLCGWDVADAARELRGDFPVIYASGNPVDQDRKVEDSVFLTKPCLASEVAKVAFGLVATTARSRE